MILNFYDFINEVLNNDSYDSDMLEEANLGISHKFYQANDKTEGFSNVIEKICKQKENSDVIELDISEIFDENKDSGKNSIRHFRNYIGKSVDKNGNQINNMTVEDDSYIYSIDSNWNSNTGVKKISKNENVQLIYNTKDANTVLNLLQHKINGYYYAICYADDDKTRFITLQHSKTKDSKTKDTASKDKLSSPMIPIKYEDEIYFIRCNKLVKPKVKEITNRGDVGEFIYFIIACCGFHYGLDWLSYNNIKDICLQITGDGTGEKQSSNENELQLQKIPSINIVNNNKSVGGKITIDYSNKYKIEWKTSQIDNENEKDLIRGTCVLPSTAAYDVIYIQDSNEFKKEIENCIEFFKNEYYDTIEKDGVGTFTNNKVDHVYILSLGPLDGTEKKEDCTIYVKSANGEEKITDIDIITNKNDKIDIKKCNKFMNVVKDAKTSYLSLKNNNHQVGQFSFGATATTEKNRLETCNNLKMFSCVFLKIGKKEASFNDIAKKRKGQVDTLYNKNKYDAVFDKKINNRTDIYQELDRIFNQNSVIDKFNAGLYNITKEGKKEYSELLLPCMEAMCNEINAIYKTSKDKRLLLKYILSSVITLQNNKIKLFDMSVQTKGKTLSQFVQKIGKNNDLIDEDENKKITVYVDRNADYPYIRFKRGGELLLSIRLALKDRVSFYFMLEKGLIG